MLNLDSSMLSSFLTTTLAEAYASLCSITSTSSIEIPAFSRSFLTPGIGASITLIGSMPTELYETTLAMGSTFLSFPFCYLLKKTQPHRRSAAKHYRQLRICHLEAQASAKIVSQEMCQALYTHLQLSTFLIPPQVLSPV